MTTGQPGQEPDDVAAGSLEGVDGEGDGGQPVESQTFFVGGRQQTIDEIVRNYEGSRAEAERWKAIAEERAAKAQAPPPQQQQESLPPWASEYVGLGVPEHVIRQQVAWQEQMAQQQAEARAAAKMQELLEGLNQISTAEGKADASLSQSIEGYSREKLDAYLNANSEAKSRYDRVYKADPESAKRLAWLELSNSAGPKGQPRHTGVPAGRRPLGPTKKEDLADLAKQAYSGTDDKAIAAYMKKLLGG